MPGLGVENLHRLSDTLYRSAQPRSRNVSTLAQLGIRTVVSLRAFNGDERRFADSGIALVRFRINTWDIDDAEVARALATMVESQRHGPVLVHCWHGADRTGVVCAAYRMVVEGWGKAEARAEMFDGGFGYHAVWRNIPAYIDRFDIDAMRGRLKEIGPESNSKS